MKEEIDGFTCPRCGGHGIEQFLRDVSVQFAVYETEDGELEFYEHPVNLDGGENLGFYCSECGAPVVDDSGDVIEDLRDLKTFLGGADE